MDQVLPCSTTIIKQNQASRYQNWTPNCFTAYVPKLTWVYFGLLQDFFITLQLFPLKNWKDSLKKFTKGRLHLRRERHQQKILQSKDFQSWVCTSEVQGRSSSRLCALNSVFLDYIEMAKWTSQPALVLIIIHYQYPVLYAQAFFQPIPCLKCPFCLYP